MAEAHVLTRHLQGAGETLRGTFNDTFDRRNPAAHAKNQSIIDKGRAEIEATRMRAAQNRAAQQTAAAGGPPMSNVDAYTPIIGAAPPPGHAQYGTQAPYGTQTPYAGPPVSGSQIEGTAPTSSRGGKLSNIMKKMKEGPTPRDGSLQGHH